MRHGVTMVTAPFAPGLPIPSSGDIGLHVAKDPAGTGYPAGNPGEPLNA